MPQELHVLQCFNCESFQVDIVKKVPKWVCKMCGEKQSLKKVYGRGTGKECRLLVQSLNEQRFTEPNLNFQESDLEKCVNSEQNSKEFDEETRSNSVQDTIYGEKRKRSEVMCQQSGVAKVTRVSKWAEFVTEGAPDKDETPKTSPKTDNIFETADDLDDALLML